MPLKQSMSPPRGVDSLTLQFPIGDQRATEGDPTDVGPEVGHDLGEVGRRVRGEVRVLHDVFGDAGQHRGQAHQTVESSN